MKFKLLLSVLSLSILFTLPAYSATGASSLSANGITNASLGGTTGYTGNNAIIANNAFGNAYINAKNNQTVGNPNVTQPGVPGHVKTQHPPFAGEAWGNHSESSTHSGGGGRGNGGDNAQGSRSAGGFGTGGSHIGGGRTGGGFHY